MEEKKLEESDYKMENASKLSEEGETVEASTSSGTLSVDIGGFVSEGLEIYKNNAVTLIIAVLLAACLASLTLGILAGPMGAGLVLMVLRMKDGENVEIGDLFQGFSYFAPSFLFTLIWGLINIVISFALAMVPFIGTAVSIFVSLAIGTVIIFGLPLIVDRKMDFWTASLESIDKVKPVFWPMLGLLIISSLIGDLGIIACGIGIFATLPISICINTVAYRKFYPKQ